MTGTRRHFMAAGGSMVAGSLGGAAEAAERQPFDLPQPSVPIAGGGRFPVRRIHCIGRNYPEHAREMGTDPRASRRSSSRSRRMRRRPSPPARSASTPTRR